MFSAPHPLASFARCALRGAAAASALSLLLSLANPAFADLIFNSVRYDGHVRVGGTTGVEEHFTDDPFPPPDVLVPLPATNPPLAMGLAPSRNLRMTVTEFLSALEGELMQQVVLTISATPPLTPFANPLDNTLAEPVQFEAFVYADDLPAGQMLDLRGIFVESFNLMPFPPPTTSMISGVGSEASPMRIQLGLAASQVSGAMPDQNGFLKLHLYYDTKDFVIPEPSALALALLGVVGAAFARHRR
jgi:hypothetical protein